MFLFVPVDRTTKTALGLGLTFLTAAAWALPVFGGDAPDGSDAGSPLKNSTQSFSGGGIRYATAATGGGRYISQRAAGGSSGVGSSAGGSSAMASSAGGSSDVSNTYEAIKSRSLRQWESLTTLRAVITKTAEFGNEEKRALQRVVGQYDYMSTDGKFFVHWDTVDMTAIRMEQADTLRRTRNLIVHGGDFTYILREGSGRAKAQKFALGVVDLMPLGGPGFFEKLERRFTPEVLAPEMLAGRPVHVIEARPKSGGDKVLHYIDKENGLLVKKQMGSRAQGTYEITVITDVDTTVTFEKHHFVFVSPEGVEVYDDTKETGKDASAGEGAVSETKDATDPD